VAFEHSKAVLGTIAALRRYPVKSMAGEALSAAIIGERGVQWDRAYAVFDTLDRQVASAKHVAKFPGLLEFSARFMEDDQTVCELPPVEIKFPDGRTACSDDAHCAQALSAWFGRPTGISAITEDLSTRPRAGKYAMVDTYFDYAPLHLLTNVAMRSLARRSPRSVIVVERFRPNLLIQSADVEDFPENGWTGRQLRMGHEVVIKVTDPCPRCAMPTLAQADLPSDAAILKRIAQSNTVYTPVLESEQPCLGAYAFVLRGGAVSVGDAVAFA
jgi:uncharacterized protein YcbX